MAGPGRCRRARRKRLKKIRGKKRRNMVDLGPEQGQLWFSLLVFACGRKGGGNQEKEGQRGEEGTWEHGSNKHAGCRLIDIKKEKGGEQAQGEKKGFHGCKKGGGARKKRAIYGLKLKTPITEKGWGRKVVWQKGGMGGVSGGRGGAPLVEVSP